VNAAMNTNIDERRSWMITVHKARIR